MHAKSVLVNCLTPGVQAVRITLNVDVYVIVIYLILMLVKLG